MNTIFLWLGKLVFLDMIAASIFCTMIGVGLWVHTRRPWRD